MSTAATSAPTSSSDVIEFGDLECSICHDVFKDVTPLNYLDSRFPRKVCDHEFCQVCIVDWLKIKKNCPLCRKSVYLNPVNN